ncbi:MAG: hypothetical protein AVDCRST_MAG49-2236 [uncultured Thermomicrobiales bacterium]|uniref:Uncharacterized protein n=1 Tax=uncultured Thermomicrobiales bacterium TaxID=1645740 RepID=A0A6J4UTA3_9BACT|nr:MAG: hypothetical protein AVDCRST_MAG49-2236 [uncultured Thermomicrobiales bacterium]
MSDAPALVIPPPASAGSPLRDHRADPTRAPGSAARVPSVRTVPRDDRFLPAEADAADPRPHRRPAPLRRGTARTRGASNLCAPHGATAALPVDIGRGRQTAGPRPLPRPCTTTGRGRPSATTGGRE